MNNPVHKVKRLVVAKDGTRHWVEEEIVGWLSTGIVDANGREIFEGDKLRYLAKVNEIFEGAVQLKDSEFVVDGITFIEYLSLSAMRSNQMEIIGHVTEDEE